MPFSGSSRESGNGGIAVSPESGTAVAVYNSSKSARPFCAKHGSSRWGGARNRADRVSDSLSLAQAKNIIEAAQFAAAIGLPFNRHVTIHWERAGIPDSKAASATGRFLKLAGDWIAKRHPQLENNQQKSNGAARIAWVWVRETGDTKGNHVHILLHVPTDMNTGEKRGQRLADNTPGKQRKGLGHMPMRWLRSITGNPYRSGTIRTERIGGSVSAALTTPAVCRANLAVVVGYIIKGTCPKAGAALELERIKPQGHVIGKRCSRSQNIKGH